MLRGKKILIISPERWGINMLSKHHYAITLASRQNTVYFLQPSVPRQRNVHVHEVPEHPGIWLIDYTSSVFGLSKLPFFLTDLLARTDLRRITQATGGAFDIVWNFDMYRYQNARLFKNAITILHPVDFVNTPLELRAASLYQFVFSVSNDILDKLRPVNPRCYFINHGLNAYFAKLASEENSTPPSSVAAITCGYVGNLGIQHLHTENLMRIITNHPQVRFHFIGPVKSSNLGTFDHKNNIVDTLRSFANVVLHGEMHPEKVASTIRSFDLFLICYNSEKGGKMVSNNHKLMEYLSTGKVVVSSRISTYDRIADGLFEMVMASDELARAFGDTLGHLNELNSTSLQQKRKAFARDNTYARQVERIEKILIESNAVIS